MEQDKSEKPLIMIVDDDSDCRTMVKTILVSNGFEVEECSGGPDALKRLETVRPALVFMDIMMPEMSGYEVVVRMKQHLDTQNIPIIMLTAKGDPEDLITGYKEYGVDYYIPKPFTTRQLLAGISLVLGKP